MTDAKTGDVLAALQRWEQFANGLWQEHPKNAERKADLLSARRAIAHVEAALKDQWLEAHIKNLQVIETELTNGYDKVKPEDRAWLLDLRGVARGELHAALARVGGGK